MDVLKNLLNPDSKVIKHVFRNSGKDYNDFGRFKECHDKKDKNESYRLLLVTCK